MRSRVAYSVAAAALGGAAGFWAGYAAVALAALALQARDRLAGCTMLAAALASAQADGLTGALLLAAAGFLHALSAPPGRPWGAPQAQRYLVVVAAVAAVAAANPAALAAAGGMLAGAAARYSRAAASIAGAGLALEAPETVAPGEEFTVVARVEAPPGSYYRVVLEGYGDARGRVPASGRARVEWRVEALHYGALRLRARGTVWDPEYTASAPLPEAEARVVSYSRASRAREALVRVLAGAADLVGPPRVVLERRLVAGGEAGAARARGPEWVPAEWVLEHAPVKVGGGVEVRGVREYVPGDPPRLIYWKKTASKGFLVVRERAEGGGGSAGPVPGASNVLIVDLRAWDWGELDSLVATLASTLAGLRGETIVYMRMPGGRELLVKGPELSVANAVEGALTGDPPRPLVLLGPPPGQPPGPPPEAGSFSRIAAAVEARAAEAAERVLSLGVEARASYTIIAGVLGAPWAEALEARLRGAGRRGS